MNERLLWVFQQEALTQCRFAMIAAKTIDAQCKAGPRLNSDELWFAIQGFLVAAGNLHKLFWGSWGKTATVAARSTLRDGVGIGAGNPLKDMALRNAFEHIDEELDLWFKASHSGNLMIRNVGPHHAFRGISKFDRFQHFDPATGVLTFKNKRVSLVPLAMEIGRLVPLLEAAVAGAPGTASGTRPPSPSDTDPES